LLLFILVGSCFAAEKPKVFVTGENSFQVSGSAGEQSVSGVGDSTVAEGIKLLQRDCSAVVVNMRRDKADYIVSVTDDGSGAARKGRRAVVFTPDGSLIFANSARSLKNAVKDACSAIEKNWAEHPAATKDGNQSGVRK
jgi:hypothetical protein